MSNFSVTQQSTMGSTLGDVKFLKNSQQNHIEQLEQQRAFQEAMKNKQR